jgi:hypothetical protein
MTTGKKEEHKGQFREFEDNPYNPERKKPEDLVRLFYSNNLPIIPVVSKKGALMGMLLKDDVVSELSDIERGKDRKIDEFITSLYKKMGFDDVLPYIGSVREFVTVNLFGEVQGRWSRVDLLGACESPKEARSGHDDAEHQKEQQVMEWMIYLILEHIPRGLYAVNQNGKTIFYNNHFEELIVKKTGKDIDIEAVEKLMKDPDINEFYAGRGDSAEICFYNKEMDFFYEKVPLQSEGKTVGFLVYCDREMNADTGVIVSGVNIRGLSLDKITEEVERSCIVDAIKKHDHALDAVARELGVSRQALSGKIKKLRISTESGDASGKKKRKAGRKGTGRKK